MSQEPRANRLEGLALALLFTAASLALLAAIGWQTRHGQVGAGWWTRPWLAPGVALGLLALANLVVLARDLVDLRARPVTPDEKAEARRQFAGWLRPLEFLAYFAAYVGLVPRLGYFPSTLLFILGLLLRLRLRTPVWLLVGLLAALALVGVFRIGLGVWMPAPELYDPFPPALRTILIRWF